MANFAPARDPVEPGTAASEAPAAVKTVAVAYHPGEGDPASTYWDGFEFQANIPTYVPARHRLVAKARANPYFSVNGQRAKVNDPPRAPLTSDQYRVYALRWIEACTSYDELVQRWDAEELMRRRLLWGEEDQTFIHQFYGPKLQQLDRARVECQR